MDTPTLKKIIDDVTKQNSLFSDKSYLDNLTMPSEILGREAQTRQLVEHLLGYQKGLVVPMVSIYGRSGAGKSSLVKFVLSNMDGVKYCFVNLRKAKTVFGCANLILSELGESELKSALGLNASVEKIEDAINAKASDGLFVLCLDEFDTLFLDKRGKPSDFIYKLLLLVEKLRSQKIHLCILTISNKILSEFDLDDRVLSRIGSSEIFFDAYTKNDVFKILKSRASKAFSYKIPDDVLRHCAEISSSEHGDARRALDLLRVSAEIAGAAGNKISKEHVSSASLQLQQNQVSKIILGNSYHFRLVCAAMAHLAYLTDDSWHSTSELYAQYKNTLPLDTKPLSYRRISKMLVEAVNSGIAVSQTRSSGRKGYGSQFKLRIDPQIVGPAISEEWWNSVTDTKNRQDIAKKLDSLFSQKSKFLKTDLY